MDDFFRFSKKLGFWVFLVHPTVVLVLLSALVERCFVSRMRDFVKAYLADSPLYNAITSETILQILNGEMIKREEDNSIG